MTFSFKLHSSESAACEKGERGERKGDKDFERQGGLGKRRQQQNAVLGGERRGSNALNSGLGEVQWLRGF